MSNRINYKQLRFFLTSLGYEETPTLGSHVVYTHRTNVNSVILFKSETPENIVPESIFNSIVRNIIEFHLADEETISSKINQVLNSHLVIKAKNITSRKKVFG